MSRFLQLAVDLERVDIEQGTVSIEVTPTEREMIVAALRGADALRTLAEFQARSLSATNPLDKSS
jgi:hypothetical protein